MILSEKVMRKAITFSYDDGVTQDIRLIELLEDFFLLISNRSDIFYGTNKEILL